MLEYLSNITIKQSLLKVMHSVAGLYSCKNYLSI